MRDRPPVWASWPEALTKTPFAVTLSMSLADFIEVLEESRSALLPPLGPRDQRGAPAERAEGEPHQPAPAPVHFPLELAEPGPIALPEIAQEGRGRPSELTSGRARAIIEMACRGASIPVCAAAGGITPNTLKSWLRRKDHEAFVMFQRYFADAETYAALATLRTVMESVASDPKRAFRKVVS
ncbi:MAG: hypothetical protein ACRELZ_02540 [Candidatus Rokuibacteriota bacterium]